MDQFLSAKRNPILFPDSAEDFRKNVAALKAEIKQLIADDPASKEYYLGISAGIAIDLRSYLPEWVLVNLVSKKEIAEVSDDLLSFTEDYGAPKVAADARKEIASIEKSTIKKMCEQYKTGETNTVWGHDYASNLTYSLRRGARWSTNNPCKVQLFKKDYPDYYQELVQEIKRENPGAKPDILAAQMFVKVCAILARSLYPIFLATDQQYGFVCMQVDPRNIRDTDAMIKQAEFWRDSMKKELGVEEPNIVIKLPAVEPAIEAAKALIAEGFKLCMTLNFTVTQHLEFAKILSESPKGGYLVLMGGQLDDAIADELEANGVANAKMIARHGAEAVIRKSYRLLAEKGYTNISIMTAAVRGPWHIQNSFAPLGGAPVLITTLPEKIEEFDENPTPLDSIMDQSVKEEYLDVLKTSKVFNQAMCTPKEGLLPWDSIYEYPPFVSFYKQFIAAYQEIEDDFK